MRSGSRKYSGNITTSFGWETRRRSARVRKQKTDSRDALHILDLLLTDRFPRIWIPSPAERDVRQLVRHRHKLVRMRTSVMNQLQALAIGQGLCRKQKLWSKVGRIELQALVLDPWAHRRRHDLLQLLDQLNPWIEATINAQWFERTLRRYHHELWIGDAAEIRAARVRKQKTDSRDALHILDLLVANRFPRIWIPSPAERDVRQLLRHRHKLVNHASMPGILLLLAAGKSQSPIMPFLRS